jgi:hypothetical protein
VRPHEGVARSSRCEPNWATEYGPDGELHLEPTDACRGSQRALVYAQLTSKLIEGQELVLSLVMHDRFSRTLQHRRGHDSSTAVPWSVGLERN